MFSDSTHFGSKKSSAEDLSHSRSESRGRTTAQRAGDAPAIRISSEHRSLGSAESLRSAAVSPPTHARSHRDLSRDLSPRGRQRREREEREAREERENSRVRCDNKLPNYLADNNRSEDANAACNRSSLTKFHQVDRQLEETCARYADNDRRSASRSPLSSPYEARTTRYNQHNLIHNQPGDTSFPRAVSPYRQPYYDPNRSTPTRTGPTPVYQPAKLEIRHTTVTSTFYDRFLMEKQIEKQTLSRPPSRSPLGGATSPSATSKSYSDLPASLAKSGESLLDAISAVAASAAVTSSSSSSYAPMSRSYAGSSSYSYLTSRTTHSATGADSERVLSPNSSSTGVSLSATTSTSIATSTTITSSSAFVPYNFSSSFSSRLKSEPPDSNTTSLSSYSTGVYNPMMSFTLREPMLGQSTSSATALYQYKSGLGYGFTGATAKSEPEKP